MTQLQIGDQAPDFALPDASGQIIHLSDFAERQVIVYFYPAALTPGCTTEAIDFTAAAGDFAQAGYAIVGISPDQPDRLRRFAEKYSLAVQLLADPERTVLAAYGAWGERSLYGKTVTGVLRSTIVVAVDAAGQGTVERAMYRVKAAGHVARLKADLGV